MGEEKAGLRSGLPSQEWMAAVTVPARDVVLFLRQLVTLFRSGVPLQVSLRILCEQADNPKLGEILYSLYYLVDEGRYFSASLARFPRVFGPIFVGLVKVGEKTGALLHSLDMLASWMERDQEVRQKVRSALVYPIIVVLVAFTCCALLMTTLAPAFLGMFADRGQPLPWPTQVVSAMIAIQKKPLAWIALILLSTGLARLGHLVLRDPAKLAKIYWVAAWLPVVRNVLDGATWSRYCGACSIMMACGVQPQSLYRLAAEASGDPRVILACPFLIKDVLEGVTPSDHMQAHPALYPKLVSYGFSVGQEAGKNPQIADFLARNYRMELDFQLTQLTNLLEPILLAGTSLILFFIILALLLPIYSQLNSLGS